MSATQVQTQTLPSFMQRHDFLLRRMHSLTGVIPVGAFLVEHLLTNVGAWYGPDTYNESVKWIQGLPFLLVLEFAFILAPLAFHAGLGLLYALAGRPNSGVYPYTTNWRYTLQRVTAYITLVFVIVHLLKFRFSHLVGGPVFAEAYDWFALTSEGLLYWQIGGLTVPWWFTLTFYLIGVTAAVYHFANGLWTFSISWGILGGPDSQRWFLYVCLLIGLVMAIWGYISLWAFYFGPQAATIAPVYGPAGI